MLLVTFSVAVVLVGPSTPCFVALQPVIFGISRKPARVISAKHCYPMFMRPPCLLTSSLRTRWLTPCLLTLLFLNGAKADPLADISTSPEHKPVLRIAYAEVFRTPMSEKVSLLRRAFDYAGYSLELVPLPGGRGLEEAASGRIDGESSHNLNELKLYPSLLPLNEPLVRVDFWVWVMADNTCPSSPQQLANLSTANVLGYNPVENIQALASSWEFKVPTVNSAMRMLQAGRIDFLVVGKAFMGWYLDELGLKIKPCLSEPLASIDYFPSLHSSHRDKLPAIEAGLRRAKAELVAQ